MQLHAISVENVRSFVEPMRLDDFKPGINIIVGPNGAGKSTLVGALRSAFFAFHRTTTLKDLPPWSAPSASPQIDVEFELPDGRYHLTKRFSKGAFAALQTPKERLEGEQAEAKLAELFGFESKPRGGGKPEHLGIPGLLWVEQGDAPDINSPVKHAGDYLRDSLASMVGEVASTDGDELLDELESELAGLRTRGREASAKSAKGDLAEAIAQTAELNNKVQALAAEQLAYSDRVDELGQIRQTLSTGRRDRPWEAQEKSAAATRQKLDELNGQRELLAKARAELGQLQADARLLDSQIVQARRNRESLTKRQQDLTDAREVTAQRTASHAKLRQTLTDLQARLDIASTALAQMQLQEQINGQELQLTQLEGRRKELASRETAAVAAHQSLQELAGAQVTIGPDDVEQLRSYEADISLYAQRAQLMATQLEFELLPDGPVTLDGEALAGKGVRSVGAPAVLEIAGVGSIVVRPGGDELKADLKHQLTATERRDDLLARLGYPSTAKAVAALELSRRQHEQSELAQARIRDLAPDGLDQLKLAGIELDGEISRTRAEVERLTGLLAPATAAFSAERIEVARDEHEQLRHQLKKAELSERQAADALASARAASLHAEQELDALQPPEQDADALDAATTSVGTPEETEATLLLRAQTMAAELASREEQCAAREKQLAEAMPENLALDLKRHTESAQAMHDEFRGLELKEAGLAAELAQVGGIGLDEDLAKSRADLERWQQREQALTLRADALAWLVGRLQQRRNEFTERLQAPLQQRIDHYLGLLMPGAELKLDANLVPVGVTAAHDNLARSLPDQSFGTREQLVMLARLAYADLLAQAGRPTLIILDDGLLHADASRLESMKRILYDAAQRHQILLFSCHPERWDDLGVAPRSLSARKPLLPATKLL